VASPARKKQKTRKSTYRKADDDLFGGSVEQIIHDVIPENELIRAEVMSDHWARVANENWDVYWFRAEHLEGKTTSLQEANRFMARASQDVALTRKIQRVCTRLCHLCGWDMRQALRFLLTGKAPMIEPIELVSGGLVGDSMWGNSGRVTISIELYSSLNTIVRAIKRLRRMAQQRTKRPIEEKTLRQAELVSESMFETEPLSQREYMRMWNEDYPEWAYTDERHFARDCKRAKASVLFMNVAPPDIGPGQEIPGAF